MASTKVYLDFIMEQLSDFDGINFRAMMGVIILCFCVDFSNEFEYTIGKRSFLSC